MVQTTNQLGFPNHQPVRVSKNKKMVQNHQPVILRIIQVGSSGVVKALLVCRHSPAAFAPESTSRGCPNVNQRPSILVWLVLSSLATGFCLVVAMYKWPLSQTNYNIYIYIYIQNLRAWLMLYERFIKPHGKIVGQNREGLQEAHDPETLVILKMLGTLPNLNSYLTW